jgi:transposase
VSELQKEFPSHQIEVWSFDEHRVGLKPIIRKVWAPIGERPSAVVCHRYEWVYLYGFVNPPTGKTEWFIIPRVNIEWLNLVLENFACASGAGQSKTILLVMDRAGWHVSARVVTPSEIYVEYLPAYSPELQPAERLWSMTDEPLVNKSFDKIQDLEAVLSERCQILSATMTEPIKNLTNYYWWPQNSSPSEG